MVFSAKIQAKQCPIELPPWCVGRRGATPAPAAVLGIGDQLDQVVGVRIQTLHHVEHGVAIEVAGALLREDDQAGEPWVDIQ